MKFIHLPTYRSAWHRFARLWRPMAGWTLLIWVLATILLGPLLTGGLSRVVLRGDRLLIGNEELLSWLLHPEGLVYLTLTGTILLLGGVIRYAGLFRLITDDLQGRPASVRQTLFALLPETPALFRLCLVTIVAALLLFAPLAAGLGGIYWYWLSEHDINYYLEVRPPEWYRALWAVAFLAVPWLLGVGYLVLRSLPTLPAFLDGHRPVKVALQRGWQRTRKSSLRLLRLLLLCFATWWIVRVIAQTVLLFTASTGIEMLAGWVSSIIPILIATAVYTFSAILLDAILSFFGFSFTAIILTKFYYEDTDLPITTPQTSIAFGSLPQEALALLRYWLRPVRSIPLIGVLFLLSGSISGWFLYQGARDPHFTVTAHRAGAFLAPENTLAALEAAIEAEADYAEIDVQRTRDGVIVVIHDADLMRVAGDPRRVAQADYADLAQLRQGGDTGFPDEMVKLATLEEFLEHSRGRIRLNIELKYYGWDPLLVPEVIRLIRRMEMEEEVVLMSLDLRAVREMKQRAPEIPIGYVASIAVGDLRQLPVDFLAVPRQIGTPRFIRSAHNRGMEVHLWTLNRADTILNAVQKGADGVITDDPILAVQIRNELTNLTALERILLLFQDLIFEFDPPELEEEAYQGYPYPEPSTGETNP
ncbi:MAG: glycerophosphoryl diester phosphodiesterase membrane domain-containing protein [Opitutales bacterium]|nr:glycerophosphoryl diester phosphodiesterase membrane domain-containing protein [Opitutales bacterium]MCH8541684.1 glycerophosphoryl diester phosphodiesterase membrane domain-containing protein [Opitutales bacterium]